MTTNPVVIHTTQDNAYASLELTNKYLAESGAKDSKGNPLKVKNSAASPTWLMVLARGQEATEWQERANIVYNALDIANCEDAQVENLALLSGLRKKQRTSTFITVQITNTTGSTMTLNSRNSKFIDTVFEYEWYIGQNITLGDGQSAYVQLYCSARNDVTLKPGITFQCLPLIEGTFEAFNVQSTSSTVQGTKEETISELRNRVMLSTSVYSMVNRAQDAISALAGISKCSIYFNPSAVNPLVLDGGISVPIRSCLIVIRGADANQLLAKTYFEYMDVQSYNPGSSFNVQTSYVRIGNLDMPVHYMQATPLKLYVRITVDVKASDQNYANYIRDTLEKYNGTTDVGQNLTTKLLSVWLDDVVDYVSVINAEVSADGTNWSSTSQIPCFNIADIDLENITYVPA